MKWPVQERVAGTTFKCTWVNCGSAPSPITSALLSSSLTVVQSLSMTSSGGGFYFGLHQTPNTPGNYVNEFRAWINSYEYVDRQLLRLFDLRS